MPRFNLRHTALTFALIVTALPAMANVTPAYIQKYLPQAQVVGQGSLTYLGIPVYDATLYAPQAQWRAGKPMALRLEYHIDLKGHKIAARSVSEMKRQRIDDRRLAQWEAEMARIFPDVTEGTVLTGVVMKQGGTRFFKNGVFVGQINDRAFTESFFNIWLGPSTSQPALRKKLLGPSLQSASEMARPTLTPKGN